MTFRQGPVALLLPLLIQVLAAVTAATFTVAETVTIPLLRLLLLPPPLINKMQHVDINHDINVDGFKDFDFMFVVVVTKWVQKFNDIQYR